MGERQLDKLEGAGSSPAPPTWLWFATDRMVVAVCVRDGRVTDGPPIVRKFFGQPVANLRLWLRRQPGFREAQLD